jgi:hypothetical protein
MECGNRSPRGLFVEGKKRSASRSLASAALPREYRGSGWPKPQPHMRFDFQTRTQYGARTQALAATLSSEPPCLSADARNVYSRTRQGTQRKRDIGRPRGGVRGVNQRYNTKYPHDRYKSRKGTFTGNWITHKLPPPQPVASLNPLPRSSANVALSPSRPYGGVPANWKSIRLAAPKCKSLNPRDETGSPTVSFEALNYRSNQFSAQCRLPQSQSPRVRYNVKTLSYRNFLWAILASSRTAGEGH